MIYKNGMWMDKLNFKNQSPTTIYDYEFKNNKLYLYMPFVKVVTRGNTLDGGMLTAEIFFYDNNLNFKLYHYKGRTNSFHKIDRKIQKAKLEEKNKQLVFSNDNGISVKFKMDPLTITIEKNDKEMLVFKEKPFVYIIDEKKQAWISAGQQIDVNEKFYGLGERFGSFVKNGQSIITTNADGGTDSEQTYKNIPFIFSPFKGYGIYVEHSEPVEFEIGTQIVSKSTFAVKGQELRFDIVIGNDPKEVLSKFSKLGGNIPRVPEWSYGLWLTTSFCTEYNEKTVLKFIDGMDKRGIPLAAFHFDCFWMKEFEWTNFKFDEKSFPDPVGLMKKIHNRGKKICLWINPYIGQKAKIWDEAAKKGYFVKANKNDVWQWDRWQAGMGLVDFTNPDAYKWYQDNLQTLIDMGVDSFKTDFGERIPVPEEFYETNEVIYYNGAKPEAMHNFYSYLYNKCVFEVLERNFGKDNTIVFARAGEFGSGKLPVHWGGDNLANYISMAQSLRGGLSLGLSGYGYWSHDIGGFEEGCEPDIYKRWTQFGLFSSHSRYHGNVEYKVPWLYGDEAVEVSKKFVEFKNKLMPYIKEVEDDVVKKGLPFMRAMFLEHPEDKNVQTIDTQYFFGTKLLVSPIFNNKGIASFYLPKGYKWLNILNNEIQEGGNWYEQKYDYKTMPLHLREGEFLLLNKHPKKTTFDLEGKAKLILFNVKEERTIKVLNKEKIVKLTITPKGVKDNHGIDIEVIKY